MSLRTLFQAVSRFMTESEINRLEGQIAAAQGGHMHICTPPVITTIELTPAMADDIVKAAQNRIAELKATLS